MVVRATPVRFWNWRMSSMTISACSILEPAALMLGPLMRLTKFWSKTAFMGLIAESGAFTFSSRAVSRTPALVAASQALSSKISQQATSMSDILASGTNSLMAGLCPSLRFPRRAGSQLCEGADGLPQSKLEGFEPGDESSGYRAHARDQNTQLALRGRNLDIVFVGQIFLL